MSHSSFFLTFKVPLAPMLRDLGGFWPACASENKQDLGKGYGFKGVSEPDPL